jgi:hypothetical protein
LAGKVAETMVTAGGEGELGVKKVKRKRNDKPLDGHKLFVSIVDDGLLEDTERKDYD